MVRKYTKRENRELRPEWTELARENQLVCRATACDLGVWQIPDAKGRRPTLCPRHSNKIYPADQEMTPVPSGGTLQTAASKTAVFLREKRRKESTTLASMPEFAAMRMSIGLSLHPRNYRAAAQVAGVMLPTEDGRAREPTKAELEELVAQATGNYPDLQKRSTPALVGLIQTFAFKNAISMLEREQSLDDKNRAFAGRLSQQTIQDVGGKRAVFATASVKMPGAKKK